MTTTSEFYRGLTVETYPTVTGGTGVAVPIGSDDYRVGSTEEARQLIDDLHTFAHAWVMSGTRAGNPPAANVGR